MQRYSLTNLAQGNLVDDSDDESPLLDTDVCELRNVLSSASSTYINKELNVQENFSRRRKFRYEHKPVPQLQKSKNHDQPTTSKSIK